MILSFSVCARALSPPEAAMMHQYTATGFFSQPLFGDSGQARSSSPMVNARMETASTKPTFKESWERRRCIVPASYYFEWEHLINAATGKADIPGLLVEFGGANLKENVPFPVDLHQRQKNRRAKGRLLSNEGIWFLCQQPRQVFQRHRATACQSFSPV